MDSKEYVLLVDENDNRIGLMEKMEAHIKGVLHRAFSVFIFNENNELILQQRALSKYHSPGLWTNTCCSHPQGRRKNRSAAHRRMVEEMGFDCEFAEAFTFLYKSDVGGGLIEHEFDHVFIGKSEKKPFINENEVSDWKYMKMEDIRSDMDKNPEKYTVWFKIAFDEVEKHLNQKNR